MAEPQTAESTEQHVTDEGRASDAKRNEAQVAERNRMAAEGTALPPVPGLGQPLEEQPGQHEPTDPAAHSRSDRQNHSDRPMESRVAGDEFTTP